jgi:hypothetical protein
MAGWEDPGPVMFEGCPPEKLHPGLRPSGWEDEEGFAQAIHSLYSYAYTVLAHTKLMPQITDTGGAMLIEWETDNPERAAAIRQWCDEDPKVLLQALGAEHHPVQYHLFKDGLVAAAHHPSADAQNN